MRCRLFLILCVFVSCKKESGTPVVKPQKFDKVAYADSLKTEREKPVTKIKTNPAPQKDSILSINEPAEFHDKTDTVYVKIHYGKAKTDTVKAPQQKMVFVLDSDTANQLNLKISTQDTLANLRISQIIDSKGNSDGPFGSEAQYKILEKGIHKIIVSESQMAGEPWGGNFSFEVTLGW